MGLLLINSSQVCVYAEAAMASITAFFLIFFKSINWFPFTLDLSLAFSSLSLSTGYLALLPH